MSALAILVANIKGGCGKTTIATNLAAAFAATHLPTVLADLDRQRSSVGWSERRPTTVPAVEAVDWSKEMGALPRQAARLVIDAPAALKRKQIEELVDRADVVIIPVLPGAFDEASTERFLLRLDELKSIARGRKAVAVIGNRVRENTRSAARLDEFLGTVGHRTVARFRETQLYNDAAGAGLGLFDLGSKRAFGYQQEWHPLLRFIAKEAA
jgi:chromosome partitioning protein